MKPNVVKVVKGLVGLASIVLPLVSDHLADRELKELVAKEVAEALKKQAGGA